MRLLAFLALFRPVRDQTPELRLSHVHQHKNHWHQHQRQQGQKQFETVQTAANELLATLTFAPETPGMWFNACSTWATHDAQVMPATPKLSLDVGAESNDK